MKDSGIEWIGEIPEHWNVTRIGSLYKLRSLKVSDRDYPPLSVTKSGILPQIENVSKTDAHDDRKLVKCGDFVINSRSDRRNSCGISKYDGSVSLINIILYHVDEINSAYFNLLFDTRDFAAEFYKWGHGIVDDLW
ncbi:MAG: restriction endonuclease subunit S, partial [Ruminococcus sp.]|nr:restriction endonuclease subunit S [Ruminococcus sp.]